MRIRRWIVRLIWGDAGTPEEQAVRAEILKDKRGGRSRWGRYDGGMGGGWGRWGR
jgi:hypothetical protein